MTYVSDQQVLDFLGKVGDAAQSKLRPEDRMRLVERLRSQINSERERLGDGGPTVVESIIDRLGTPEAIVSSELYRAPSYNARGALSGGEDSGTAGVRQSRHASEARYMGFRGDGTPIPAVRVDDGEEADEPDAPAGPPGQRTGSPDDDLWWRTPPAGSARVGEAALGEQLIGAPAYPVGLAPYDPDAPEDELPLDPEVLPSRFELRTHIREWTAMAILVLGAAVGSTAVVVIGFLAVGASLVWTTAQRRVAYVFIPFLTMLGFAVAMWLRANGHWGPDLTRAEAARKFGDLLFPVQAQVAGIAAAVYLLWNLVRVPSGD